MDQSRLGYLYALGAYLCWGFMPVYFKVLRPATALEILAHRVLWSVVFVALLLILARRWRDVSALLHRRRMLAGLGLAAALIAVNWFTYIYGVNTGHVVETSLGYFINPLISVAFGVLLLGERLRPLQWVALAIGAVAVVALTVDYGRPPYIALILAVSFGSYGLVKKRLGAPPAQGLLVESGMLALPVLAYLGLLTASGTSTFGAVSAWHTVLLLLAGVFTAVPLLMFAGAANRIPMAGLGMLQYLTPTLQLLLGVLVYHEPMARSRLAGFGLVWLALAVFTWDLFATGRRAGTTGPRTATTRTQTGTATTRTQTGTATTRTQTGTATTRTRTGTATGDGAGSVPADQSTGVHQQRAATLGAQLDPADLGGIQAGRPVRLDVGSRCGAP